MFTKGPLIKTSLHSKTSDQTVYRVSLKVTHFSWTFFLLLLLKDVKQNGDTVQIQKTGHKCAFQLCAQSQKSNQ